MLQSKYLTKDGLTAWFKECYNLGFKYLFYNPDRGIHMLSKQEPVFRDITFMYCDGEKYPFVSYFSKLVAEDLLTDRNYIAIEDHIDTVDWSKVPVDTPVLVRDDNTQNWKPRYFAKYEDGAYFVYTSGQSSWSTSTNAIVEYNYIKLADNTNK